MTNIKKSTKWWEYVRDEELKPALNFFPKKKHSKILEVGGGNGYQASKILKMGYDITSIDIVPAHPSYFDVQKMDVTVLPYPDNHFDLILTSLVLQHIKNLDSAFLEMNRVLKHDGMMIHIVPTSWWTIFTNFWHYFYIPKFLFKSFLKKFNSQLNLKTKVTQNVSNEIKNNNHNKFFKLKLLFLNPLGYNSSFISDIFYFRKNYWKKKLEKYSLKIIDIKNCPISSTGYAVFRNKLLKVRKFFALHHFPTIICIVVKKL